MALQRGDDRRRPPVVLPVLAEAHASVVGKHPLGAVVAVRGELAGEDVLRDLGESDPADGGDRARKAAIDHLRAKPQRFEDLGAAVRGQRRDPHFREDLEEALLGGGAECGWGLRCEPGLERRKREPGVHRFRAVADQRREVMHVPRVSGLRGEAEPRAQTLAEQVLVHRTDRQEHRDRRVLAIRVAIAHDHDARAEPHGALRRGAQRIERRAERVRPDPRPPQRRQRHPLIAREVAQGRDLVFQKNWMLGADQSQGSRTVREQRAAPAEMHAQRHDEGLAQRVDRRVRHLREALADIRVQALRNARQRGDRRVVPHAPHRVLARRRHGLGDVAQVLEAPAEGELARHELRPLVPRRRDPGGRAERADGAGGPARVRSATRHLPLGVGVVEDGLAPRVHHDELTGAQTPAFDHVPRIHVHEPHLGPGDEQAVARDLVAAGPQAVAVQRGAGDDAVRERQRRGTVPRLDEALVELVEPAERASHLGGALVGLRHEHHQGVHGVAAGADQ